LVVATASFASNAPTQSAIMNSRRRNSYLSVASIRVSPFTKLQQGFCGEIIDISLQHTSFRHAPSKRRDLNLVRVIVNTEGRLMAKWRIKQQTRSPRPPTWLSSSVISGPGGSRRA
jgi:hypothetical protein